VWAVDPNQPIVKVETMDQIITNSIWRPRFSAWLFSVLGGLALPTSAGVYRDGVYHALRARKSEPGSAGLRAAAECVAAIVRARGPSGYRAPPRQRRGVVVSRGCSPASRTSERRVTATPQGARSRWGSARWPRDSGVACGYRRSGRRCGSGGVPPLQDSSPTMALNNHNTS
jgi:hypothetical protein